MILKLFHRGVTLLLIPCLLAEPVVGSGGLSSPSVLPHFPSSIYFEQVLAAEARWANQPFFGKTAYGDRQAAAAFFREKIVYKPVLEFFTRYFPVLLLSGGVYWLASGLMAPFPALWVSGAAGFVAFLAVLPGYLNNHPDAANPGKRRYLSIVLPGLAIVTLCVFLAALDGDQASWSGYLLAGALVKAMGVNLVTHAAHNTGIFRLEHNGRLPLLRNRWVAPAYAAVRYPPGPDMESEVLNPGQGEHHDFVADILRLQREIEEEEGEFQDFVTRRQAGHVTRKTKHEIQGAQEMHQLRIEAKQEQIAQRTTLLDASLRSFLETPLERFQQETDNLREPLVDLMDNKEMSASGFLHTYLEPAVRQMKDGERFLVGLGGSWASGKSTVARWLVEQLQRRLGLTDSAWIRSCEFDDFLKDREDREDMDTQDPEKKFAIQRFKKFMDDLKSQRRAEKPVYDQAAKGQLKFGLDAKGDIVIYFGDVDGPRAVAGNRTLTVHANISDRTFNYSERLMTDKGIVDLTAKRQSEEKEPIANIPGVNLTCGETSIKIFRGTKEADDSIYVWVRDDLFYRIRQNDGQAVVDTLSWLPREGKAGIPEMGPSNVLRTDVLSADKTRKVEALEIFEPVPAGEKQIIIVPGILTFKFQSWNMSAMLNMSFPIQLLRSIQRELRRGRNAFSLGKTITQLIERQRTEDVPINQLNKEMMRDPSHYQINNMTLPELMLRHILFGDLRADSAHMVPRFAEKGITNLPGLIESVIQKGEEALMNWLKWVRKNQGKTPLKLPKFPGEKRLEPEEEMHRYWNGKYRTFGVGTMILKFMLPHQRGGKRWKRVGTLPPEDKETLEALRARGGGLFMDYSIVDLPPEERSFLARMPLPPKSPAPETLTRRNYRLQLETVMVANLLYYVEGRLNGLADEYEKVDRGAAKADLQAVYQKGCVLIDQLFPLNRRYWDRGIVDRSPNLLYRHGFAFAGLSGEEHLIGTAPSSIIVNDSSNRALKLVDQLAEQQDALPLPAVEEYTGDPLIKIPYYDELSGFQKQFLRDLYPDGSLRVDYFRLIPDPWKAHYIEQVFYNVPRDGKEMVQRYKFEEEWKKAGENQTREKFRIRGITAFEVQEEQMNVLERANGLQFHLPRLYHYVDRQFKEGHPFQGRPPLAWACAFYYSMAQMDDEKTLSLLAKTFYGTLLGDSLWLVRTLQAEGQDARKSAQILFQQTLALLNTDQVRSRKPKVTVKKWEEEEFIEFLVTALQLPPTWTGPSDPEPRQPAQPRRAALPPHQAQLAFWIPTLLAIVLAVAAGAAGLPEGTWRIPAKILSPQAISRARPAWDERSRWPVRAVSA